MAIWAELLAGFTGQGIGGGGRWHGRQGSCCNLWAYIYKALIRRRLTGDSGPSLNRGHRPRKLTPDQEAALAAHIDRRRGTTLMQLQSWLLSEHGVKLSTGAMWHAVRRLGLSFRKTSARRRAGSAGCGSTAPIVEGGSAVH